MAMDLTEKQKNVLEHLTENQISIINEYHTDEMCKLKKICNPLIFRKNVPIMYHDDLYAVASNTLLESLSDYDETRGVSFENYLKGNINRAFYDWTRDSRRGKRCNLERDECGRIKKDEEGNPIVIYDISFDAPTENDVDLCEKIRSDFCIEDNLSEEIGFSFGDNVNEYMQSLTNKQKEIAQLFLQGYKSEEVKEILGLTEKKYKRYLSFMQKPEKRRLLKQNYHMDVEEDNQMQTQTRERSKETQYSILSLIKKIDGYTFRFDHPTQREPGRWNSKMKGNLISDILQNNPLPHLIFAEQIIDGVAVTWNLDGKQKSTNVYDFYNNKFKVNKDVRRWEIEYQTKKVDEDGKVLLQNNLPIFEPRTFDIRGKKFKDLPEELQERFCDYTFQCTQYLNCSDEDIEYHICRYNEGVRLNGSEKGMGEIGTKYAALIKEIASMPFFTERGGYKVSEFNNGTMNRVIAESIMAINYLDEWKKKPEEICSFMKDQVSEETFENFTDMVDRLDAAATDSVCELFDSKDSFLYFGLFARFIDTGVDDEKFIEFMTEFSTNQSLHTKEIDGITYKSLCVDENGKSKSTKDKNIVVAKIKLLEKLMYEFLKIDVNDVDNEHKESISNRTIQGLVSTYDFIRENVSTDIVPDDINTYEDTLYGYTAKIDKDAKQIVDKQIQAFVALVAYAFPKEVDDEIPNWLVDYTHRVATYSQDQKENYLHMKNDFDNYLVKKGVAA